MSFRACEMAYIALREAIISISTFAAIGSAATAMVERAG
jgi:hypothetical protein